MANRNFQEKMCTIDKSVVSLYCSVSVAGGGAVTLQKWNPPNAGVASSYAAAPTSGLAPYGLGFRGIKSITRTGTGAWTLALQDSYMRLLGVSATVLSSTGIPTAPNVGVDTDLTDVASTTAPAIGLVFSSGGAATDPGSGEQVLLTFVLQNSSAP